MIWKITTNSGMKEECNEIKLQKSKVTIEKWTDFKPIIKVEDIKELTMFNSNGNTLFIKKGKWVI